MSTTAENCVYQLPREIDKSLNRSAKQLLLYLADRAEDADAKKNGGQYYVSGVNYPEHKILRDLKVSRATLYRALDQLEFGCGFYLITRRNASVGSCALYDLHLFPQDLTPEAIQERGQIADARRSAAPAGRGIRKRNTAPVGQELPGITSHSETCTSQGETYFPENHVSKRDVNTSHGETESPKITSHHETHITLTGGTTTRKQGDGGTAAAPPPAPESAKLKSRKSGTQNPDPIARVTDVHAEIWTALADELLEGIPLPAELEKENNPAAYRLLYAGFNHIGGKTRFRTIKARPREASFARDEFLKFLRNNDPAYEAAVAESINASLEEKPSRPKTKVSARSP